MGSGKLENLLLRRARLLHLTIIGVDVSKAIDKVAEEFKCGKRTLYRDWKTRGEWIPLFVKTSPEEMKYVVWDALASLAEAKQEAYRAILSSEGMARVAAVRVYLDCVKTEIEMRQDLGLLPTEPLRMQRRIIMLRGHFVELGPNGELPDEEEEQSTIPALPDDKSSDDSSRAALPGPS